MMNGGNGKSKSSRAAKSKRGMTREKMAKGGACRGAGAMTKGTKFRGVK
jgi:hypothetical protein